MSTPLLPRLEAKALLLALLLLVLPGRLHADSLSWDRNADPGVAGYVVSYGFTSGVYVAAVDVGNVVSWQLPSFTPGVRYYFAVAAYNTGGQYSGPSNEVSWTAPAAGPTPAPVVSSPDEDPDDGSGAGDGGDSVYTPPQLVAFAVKPGGRVVAGTTLRLAARATGGLGPLQYRFSVAEPGRDWRVVRDYGASPNAQVRPVAPGKYRYRVSVKSAGSVEEFEAIATATVAVNAAKARLELSADRGEPFAPSVPVELKATMVGSADALEYRFLRYRQGALAWVALCGYSTSATCDWKPTMGSQRVVVQARRKGSRGGAQYTSPVSVFRVASSKARLVDVDVNQVFPLPAKTTITIATKAVGGSAALVYEFQRYDAATGRWSVVQGFSPASTFAWMPAADQWGDYAFRVRVRSAGSPAAESAATTGLVTITP
jgi:hypothetical protein